MSGPLTPDEAAARLASVHGKLAQELADLQTERDATLSRLEQAHRALASLADANGRVVNCSLEDIHDTPDELTALAALRTALGAST